MEDPHLANAYTYTRREEIANAITHGIGALVSLPVLALLVTFAALKGDARHVAALAVYGATMLMLYVSSTLVHSLPPGRAKDVFETLDHASIFLFIAGTYTPFALLVLRGAAGWTLFGAVWGLALAGAVFKAFFVKKFLFLSTLLYVALGWIALFAWEPLAASLPPAGLGLLVAGGVAYTAGTVFFVWRGFPFHHMVWHLFVLAGSLLHAAAVFFSAIPW